MSGAFLPRGPHPLLFGCGMLSHFHQDTQASCMQTTGTPSDLQGAFRQYPEHFRERLRTLHSRHQCCWTVQDQWPPIRPLQGRRECRRRGSALPSHQTGSVHDELHAGVVDDLVISLDFRVILCNFTEDREEHTVGHLKDVCLVNAGNFLSAVFLCVLEASR